MTKRLASLFSLYEARLAKLRKLAEIIDSDDEFAQELVDTLSSPPGDATPNGASGPTLYRVARGAQIDRLRAYFKDRGNEWSTTSEICKGTGILRSSLAPLLSRNLERLESRAHPKSLKVKQWRLKSDAQKTP